MKKTCLLSGNFALDTIVTRDYPNGFVVGKSNKFTETIVAETVGNTCGNVACMLAYLGVQTFPIAHLDLSEQGLKIKEDLQQYGADVRFVENSESGGTTLLRCTHKRDKTTGEHTVSFRATSPGSRFPKRRFLRVRDEAPAFMESLDFTPDVFFFDAAEAGLRYLAGELRKRGTLVYFEPESDADKNKFLKAIEVSDIIKFSHEKVGDISFTAQYKDKLFIRTLGAEGLEFNLCGQGWAKVASVPNDNVVDWEGAGDWTTSQFIACLCERDILSISQMTANSVRECLEIACTTASHSVSYLGSKGMIDAKVTTIPLKADGSLDVESINNLPVKEHCKVVGSLTKRQMQEYLSKSPIADANAPRSIRVDKPIEEWGVDAMEFLNKMRRNLK